MDALRRARGRDIVGQHLDRDVALEARVTRSWEPAASRESTLPRTRCETRTELEACVARTVDLAHPARTEWGDDLAGAEQGRGSQRHRPNQPQLRVCRGMGTLHEPFVLAPIEPAPDVRQGRLGYR